MPSATGAIASSRVCSRAPAIQVPRVAGRTSPTSRAAGSPALAAVACPEVGFDGVASTASRLRPAARSMTGVDALLLRHGAQSTQCCRAARVARARSARAASRSTLPLGQQRERVTVGRPGPAVRARPSSAATAAAHRGVRRRQSVDAGQRATGTSPQRSSGTATTTASCEPRLLAQHPLDGRERHLHPARDQHVVATAGDGEPLAVRTTPASAVRNQRAPPSRHEPLGRQLGVAEVALGQARAAEPDLAVDDLHRRGADRDAVVHAAAAGLARAVAAAHPDAGMPPPGRAAPAAWPGRRPARPRIRRAPSSRRARRRAGWRAARGPARCTGRACDIRSDRGDESRRR